jgi:hypothetical protein
MQPLSRRWWPDISPGDLRPPNPRYPEALGDDS